VLSTRGEAQTSRPRGQPGSRVAPRRHGAGGNVLSPLRCPPAPLAQAQGAFLPHRLARWRVSVSSRRAKMCCEPVRMNWAHLSETKNPPDKPKKEGKFSVINNRCCGTWILLASSPRCCPEPVAPCCATPCSLPRPQSHPAAAALRLCGLGKGWFCSSPVAGPPLGSPQCLPGGLDAGHPWVLPTLGRWCRRRAWPQEPVWPQRLNPLGDVSLLIIFLSLTH